MSMIKHKTLFRDGVSQLNPSTISLTEFITALIVVVSLKKPMAQSSLVPPIVIMMVAHVKTFIGEKPL